MSSIFDKTDNQSIIDRINSLTPDSMPLWGKMSVDQMLKHVNESIVASFGETPLKVNFILRLMGKLMKNRILNSEFKKNSPTLKEYVFTAHYDFEKAKSEFIKNFSRYTEGPESITLKNDPLWGKMSYEDWNKLMWNHITHHLKQFGV